MQSENTDQQNPVATGAETPLPPHAAALPPVPARHTWIFGREPRKTLQRLGIWFILVLCLFNFLLVPMTVVGTSMEPSYEDGQVDFYNRWPYSGHPPRRGDVVAIQISPNVIYLKRVIGLPGETVSFVGGRIAINGKLLDEPYVRSVVPEPHLPWFKPLTGHYPALGPDEYFVIGDNRAVTVFPKIKRSQILGKVVF